LFEFLSFLVVNGLFHLANAHPTAVDLFLLWFFLSGFGQFVDAGWYFADFDLKGLLNFILEVLHVDGLLFRGFLAHFEWLGIKILIDSVGKTGGFIENGLGIFGGIDPPGYNAHLIFIESQILNAICIAEDRLDLIIYLMQGQVLQGANIDIELLQLFEQALLVHLGFGK
jgi:hypothetical protein